MKYCLGKAFVIWLLIEKMLTNWIYIKEIFKRENKINHKQYLKPYNTNLILRLVNLTDLFAFYHLAKKFKN